MVIRMSNIILSEDGEEKVIINLNDGTIKFKNGYTPTEGAKLFWDAVADNSPDKPLKVAGATSTNDAWDRAMKGI